MEIEGMIILNLGRTTGTSKAGNPWKKDEYVLETGGTYPRKVKFTVFGDRADTVQFEMGKKYALNVEIDSREFNGRWYTDVMCLSARPLDNAAPAAPAAPAYGAAPAQQPAPATQDPFGTPQGDQSDDLPF